jgi:hypothetical protein
MTDEHCIDCGLHVFECECTSECAECGRACEDCDCDELEAARYGLPVDGYTTDMAD